jgi:hypothetical protein
MKKLAIAAVLTASVISGCATVPTESVEVTTKAKQFEAPSVGNAGIYVYRAGSLGGALKKDIFVNDKCLGQSAPDVFFYTEVAGDKQHKLSTESEFSNNDLMLYTEPGKHYFIEQYIKMGVFVGGARLKQVDTLEGKSTVSQLAMAKSGDCSAKEVKTAP